MTLTWYSIIVSYKKLQINIVNIHWKLHKSSTKIQYNGEKENDKKTNKIVHRKHMNFQVRVITVFTVFRLLTDFVCLYTYEF
jgi:hypothetical protein